MATFSSKATGNWSASGQTTWNEVGVPTDGDTVTIGTGHTITITVGNPVTVGSSPATGGTAAIALVGTAALIVNANLTLKGDLTQQKGTSVTSATAGITIGAIMPAGASYVWKSNTSGSGAMTVTLTGASWASPITIKRISGATNDTFTMVPDFFSAHVVTLTYVRFEDMGASAVAAFSLTGSGSAINITWRNVAFVNCGACSIDTTSTTATLDILGIDFRTCKGANAATFKLSGARSSGTRRIQQLTGYDASTPRTVVYQIRDLTSTITYNTHNFSHNAQSGAFLRNADFADSLNSCDSAFSAGDTAQMTLPLNGNVTIKRTLFARIGSQVNSHPVVFSGSSLGLAKTVFGGAAVDGNVCAASGDSPDDDDGVATQGDCDVDYNLFVQGYGALNNNSAGTVNFRKNTVVTRHTAGQHSYGIITGELASATPSAMNAVQDNLLINLGTQAAGVASGGWDFRNSVADIPMTNATVGPNGYYQQNISGVNSRALLWHKALNRLSYVNFGVVSGASRVRVASSSAAAGTNSTTVKSAALYASVVVGDIVYCPSKGTCAVASVPDSSTITLDLTTSSLSSALAPADTIIVLIRPFSDGAVWGGSTTRGSTDVYADPQFTASDNDLATWSTSLGGAGTKIDAVKKMVAINGLDETGASTTYNTAYDVANALTYYRAAFQPTNSVVKAASDGTWLGAVDGQSTNPFELRRRRRAPGVRAMGLRGSAGRRR